MSELTDEDREAARAVAAAMPPWTQAEIDDMARIARDAVLSEPVTVTTRAS